MTLTTSDKKIIPTAHFRKFLSCHETDGRLVTPSLKNKKIGDLVTVTDFEFASKINVPYPTKYECLLMQCAIVFGKNKKTKENFALLHDGSDDFQGFKFIVDPTDNEIENLQNISSLVPVKNLLYKKSNRNNPGRWDCFDSLAAFVKIAEVISPFNYIYDNVGILMNSFNNLGYKEKDVKDLWYKEDLILPINTDNKGLIYTTW